MMNNLGEEGPPVVQLYEITVVSPDGSEVFNIRIDDSGSEVKLILTKEETNTMWQIDGTVGNNQLIAIGTPGGTEFWTAIVEAPSIGFRPLRDMGNRFQFFALTQLIGNQYLMERPGAGPNDPPKNIGTDELPQEGQVILSDSGLTIFQITEITP